VTAFSEYFRCAPGFATFEVAEHPTAESRFFSFDDAVCYGRVHVAQSAPNASSGDVPDVSADVIDFGGGRVALPFDLSQVVANLRGEVYTGGDGSSRRRMTEAGLTQALYYFVRPFLPVTVRRHLQRVRFRDWRDIRFPRWPVDFSVDRIMAGAMTRALMSRNGAEIPFVWFWPDGASSCAIMTHDVETRAGCDFCDALMDLDDRYGIKSSFQIVPEVRYAVTDGFLQRFRDRGFEVNVHDLNHDGRLFRTREQFLARAGRINEHARRFRSRGFRAGAMYRRQEWFDALELSYDMSVPNVAHLEPQRGGCCTVMPYFIGNLVELPLTATQDYSLFQILGEYSTQLWRTQIDSIREHCGLISFIAHPDYLIEKRARAVFAELLAYLQRLRAEYNTWIPLPSEVDRWWRNRSQMTLRHDGDTWRVEGPDSARARVAYAALDGTHLVYRIQEPLEDRDRLRAALR
jgi:hypothetical protein